MAENYKQSKKISATLKRQIYVMGKHFTRRFKEMGLTYSKRGRRFTHVNKNNVVLKFYDVNVEPIKLIKILKRIRYIYPGINIIYTKNNQKSVYFDITHYTMIF